jgi:prepilin-type N-terminal cleavage/methylation domain-containing protein
MVMRRQKGMTLIEVMIALVVTTVGLLGALAMIGSLYVGSAFNRNVTEALTLAQSKVEEINSKVVTISSPIDGLESTETLDAYGLTAVSATPVVYTRKVTWYSTRAATVATRNAVVEVSWTDGANKTHKVNLTVERIP